MIGRSGPPKADVDQALPRSFDDYDLRLGDIMRGERATMGKSLLDVQRELKIKASYIAAIENADASAFETPGFVAGYVRSYSRYLDLDPEWAFETFCREAGFVSASTSDKLGTAPKSSKPVFRKPPAVKNAGYDPFAEHHISFAPKNASAFASFEPRAIGSLLVLLLLIGGVGYGGWSVLNEIQRVQITPVDRAPLAIAEVDPIAGVKPVEMDTALTESIRSTPDPVGRIVRPKPLEAPIMIARDGPIAAQDPDLVGFLNGGLSSSPRTEVAQRGSDSVSGFAGSATNPTTVPDAIFAAVTEAMSDAEGALAPRVTESTPEVVLVAVDAAWVRIRAADGSVILEKTLNAGETFVVPQTEEPATLRTGAAGAVFFAVNGETYGPAGGNGQVVDKIALSSIRLTESYVVADTTAGGKAEEAKRVVEAMLELPAELPGTETAPPAE